MSGAEIIGPIRSYELVVDGWRVPLVSAVEETGGWVCFIVDGRLGFTVPVGAFDQVAALVANAVAVAVGLPCHPTGDMTDAERERAFAHVTHPTLLPRRTMSIEMVSTELEDPELNPEDEEA